MSETDLSELLAAHQVREVGRVYTSCSCNWYGSAYSQHLSDLLRDHDAALTAKAKAEALREAADVHEAQLVCCDVFERLRDKPSREWSDAERQEMRGHAICYWGAASAEGDRERADRMTP